MKTYLVIHRAYAGNGSALPRLGQRTVAIAIGVAAVAALMQLAQAAPANAASQAQLPGGVAVHTIEPEMVRVPSGQFEMGSSPMEVPIRRVNIRAFKLGKYEVTQGQWRAVMGSNPSAFSRCGDHCPVENVSWDDIQQYIRKLNRITGETYRLPSEAEWEYAARAGASTHYWWGDTASHEYANYGKDDCCAGITQGRDGWKNTAPVGQFTANAFGLHDMHGNVWEWVQDVWHDAPTDGSARERGDASRRVLRGGSWVDIPQNLRSATRDGDTPDHLNYGLGFRLAKAIP